MVSQHRQQLSRPSLNSQQPLLFAENAPLFSPALPTSIQQGMHPPFVLNAPPNPLQTPMQASFFPQQPGAPGRPSLHRSHPSMMQLAAAGILPPPGLPMTPIGQVGFPQSMVPGLAPYAPPFVPRSKRSASMSVGGPPKAVLGGPQRKVSPLPVTPAAPALAAAGTSATLPAPKHKTKKVIVNLPRETIPREGDEPSTRAFFARAPLLPSEIPVFDDAKPPETNTIELYPSDSWRYHLPPTVDVFLPGKAARDPIKQRTIEEKLQRLGVERGTGSLVPHIHAPHARAASISSPADPALLFFKLNKLQQSQNASGSNSLSTSPQLSPSPSQGPLRLQNRHGHSISLAQSSLHQSPGYNASFNPFGPSATLGSDQVFPRASPGPASAPAPVETIHAPQGRIAANIASLTPPASLSRPESRPDFFRGFGVEIPEEEEAEEEESVAAEADASVDDESDPVPADTTVTSAEGTVQDQDGMSTAAQSRMHSRHVSKLSAALSLRSVGGTADEDDDEIAEEDGLPIRSPAGELRVEDLDGDNDADLDGDGDQAVGEWTDSEDLRTTSEDESIGEWSNPSDEERARQDRLHRRMLRRVKQVKQDLEIPRRLPNFPRPPGLSLAVPGMQDSGEDEIDIVSNPSDEGHGPYDEFMGRHSAGGRRPLPPLPHSRTNSQFSTHTGHDPALAHSRNASEQYMTPGGLHPRPTQLAPIQSMPPAPRTESLNPFAKPFVFGAHRQSQSGSWANGAFTNTSGTPDGSFPASHVRSTSFGKPLNATAQEFKPNGFTFRPPAGVPQLTFQALTSVPRPLPSPPAPAEEVVRASQGREKRQRRSTDYDGEDEDGTTTMTSFRFPPTADAVPVRHSAPASPPTTTVGVNKDSGLSAAAKPFTFSGSLPFLPQKVNDVPQSPELSEDEEENMPARRRFVLAVLQDTAVGEFE